MITIVAEKPDVGNKIAAALDHITLKDGRTIDFNHLKANERAVKAQQSADGYLKIKWMGQDCYVTWGYGHLCSLVDVIDYNPAYKSWLTRPMPFIPTTFRIGLRHDADPKWAKRTKDQFERVKLLMNKADYVINATDFDREGEVIFSYIYELAGCTKPVKRACFSSQTKEGLTAGFTSGLKDGAEMKNIDAAGRMRGIADWTVGTNLTVAITKKRPKQGVLSVGRVQTPTLAMIVNREKAIRDFKPEPYFAIEATFTTPLGETVKAKHKTEKIKDKMSADAIMARIAGKNGIVADLKTETTKRMPPHLYSLSALQMDANSKFSYSLSETLSIAQALYDGGYTTYPRTDSQYLTDDMEPTVNAALDKLMTVPAYKALIDGKARSYNKKYYFDSTKVESHFAIIPTGTIPSGLTEKEMNIYDLICRSMIKMLYHEALIERTKAQIDVNGETFLASGSTIKDPGWMVVGDSAKEEFLPKMEIDDVLKGDYKLLSKKTEPPKRYSEKTLLAAMLSAGKDLDDEDLKKIMSDPKTGGIGTEATRAAIVETLLRREYIKREKKSIVATEKGIDLIDNLPVDELKSAELTARWEQRLSAISRGEESADIFRRDFEEAVTNWCKTVESQVSVKDAASISAAKTVLDVNCPLCGKPIRKTPFGYGCSGWSKEGESCKWTIGTICKKKLTDAQVKKLITDKKTAMIKGFTSKSGKKFDAALKLAADGKIMFDFENR